jgi:hypothetical protein
MLISEKLKKKEKSIVLILMPIVILFFIIGMVGYVTDNEILISFLFLSAMILFLGLFLTILIMYRHQKKHGIL